MSVSKRHWLHDGPSVGGVYPACMVHQEDLAGGKKLKQKEIHLL